MCIRDRYLLYQIALEYEHEVVRLRPYHCYYNLIELVWAQIENKVAIRNDTFKLEDVNSLANEVIENIPAK